MNFSNVVGSRREIETAIAEANARDEAYQTLSQVEKMKLNIADFEAIGDLETAGEWEKLLETYNA